MAIRRPPVALIAIIRLHLCYMILFFGGVISGIRLICGSCSHTYQSINMTIERRGRKNNHGKKAIKKTQSNMHLYACPKVPYPTEP